MPLDLVAHREKEFKSDLFYSNPNQFNISPTRSTIKRIETSTKYLL